MQSSKIVGLPSRTGRTTPAGVRLAALAMAAMLWACSGPTGPVVTVDTGQAQIPITVELALTPAVQQRGLMWRSEVPDGTGMLFVFDQEQPRSFWMKNTPTSLDIIYADAKGQVVSIAKSTRPYSKAPLPSEKPAKYVLEVAAGFANKHGLAPGHRLLLPEIDPAP